LLQIIVRGTGATNPPEWWHHCQMIFRHPLAASVVLFVLAAFLAGCSTSGKHRNDAGDEALLQTLRQCLVEVSISGERNQDFISPCVGRDVSSLNGIDRSRLVDALGPPRLCMSQTDINFPGKEKYCPLDQNPLWSFYRHAGSIDVGGGPELACVANKEPRCVTVEWRRTK
jgi:hypothetical protein